MRPASLTVSVQFLFSQKEVDMPLSRRTLWIGGLVLTVAVVVVIAVLAGGGGGGGGGGYGY
jgi:hypothetical protein